MAGRGSPLTVGRPQPEGVRISAARNRTSDQYFATIGQPLLAGRDFTAGDRAGAPPVAIVNETLAGRLWPGEHAIGRRIRILEGEDTGDDRDVIGVVKDAKYASYGVL